MASIVPIFVPHAGCPCQCVFCNQRTIAGQKQRMTPAQARGILQHAHAILPAGNIPQAAFYGGSFTAIPVEQQEELLAVTDEFFAAGSSVKSEKYPPAESAMRRALYPPPCVRGGHFAAPCHPWTVRPAQSQSHDAASCAIKFLRLSHPAV